MRDTGDEALLKKRLEELALRSERVGKACFTEFLTPPEAQWAIAAARNCGVESQLFGGYDDAERCVARFGGDDEPFPVTALEIEWPHQNAPSHRDLLGGVMGLGYKRSCIGDIVLEPQRAYLFALATIAPGIADSFSEAGRVKLRIALRDMLPALEPLPGEELRDTVSSPRLDAVLGCGFGLSRAKAAELITTGKVKLRHLPEERPDARVGEGDTISLRGYGRLSVTGLGQPTRKGRIPMLLIRYGERRGR